MSELMQAFVLIVPFNVGFLVVIALSYSGVTRRRERICMLVEHLAAIARQGMPLQTGLRVVGEDLGGTLGRRLERVARRLEEGRPLAEAFEELGNAFPPLFRSLMAVGERNGNLPAFLEEMRRSYRRIAEQPWQMSTVLIYPLCMTFFVNLVLLSLVATLSGKFRLIFEQLRLTAVVPDRWSQLVTASEIILAMSGVVVLFVIWGGMSPHFGAAPFRRLGRLLDALALRTPVQGTLVRDGSAHIFALSLGLLLRAGAGLPEAVRSAVQAEPNSALRRRYAPLAAHVEEGGRLSAIPDRTRYFPEDFWWFVETGEASGALPDACLQAALHYDTRTRFSAQLASRAVVPAFAFVNGALVLGAMLQVFVPILAALRSVTP